MKTRFQEHGGGAEDYNDDSRGKGGGLREYGGGVDQRLTEHDSRAYASEILVLFTFIER